MKLTKTYDEEMVQIVNETHDFEFIQRTDKISECFDDFDATPCPLDWDRYRYQSSFAIEENRG